jgi:hypothetical protein
VLFEYHDLLLFMLIQRHRRRGPYSLARRSAGGYLIRWIVTLIVFGTLIYVSGSWVLKLFGVDNPVRRTATILRIEGRGGVQVALEGGDLKRAENDLKLYPGDHIITNETSRAQLIFFEKTFMHLDSNTKVNIQESSMGKSESNITVSLKNGSMWIASPSVVTFSGSIIRKIETPYMTVDIPSRTEVFIGSSSLVVFAADGLGVTVHIRGEEDIFIGEGQKFIFPGGDTLNGNLYRYRSPLDPIVIRSSFVEESREILMDIRKYYAREEEIESERNTSEESTLTITSPEDGITVLESTVKVEGRVNDDVTLVRANGYLIPIDQELNTFVQELTLPDEDEVAIRIEAQDKNGNTIGEVVRTILRDREPPDPPTILAPGTDGAVYRTQAGQIEIHGEVPSGTVGVMVNDYRLQLFSPSDTEWSYLANSEFGNLNDGENLYEIRTINAAGITSEPATITILKEEGLEGIVTEGETISEGTTEEISPKTLPVNDPIAPGTLHVEAPSSGVFHRETKDLELLIEGITGPNTRSIWVNDYRLQLFEHEKGFWNYIASVELNTLKRGKNEYRIVARDKDLKILDTVTYTIQFEPWDRG